MAELGDLGYDDFLYREQISPNQKQTEGQRPTTNVEPGTIIQSCTWQTSPGDDRIELTPDDVETVYRDNVAHIIVTRDGIKFVEAGEEYIFDTYSDTNRNDLLITRNGFDDFIAVGSQTYYTTPEDRVAVYKRFYYQPDDLTLTLSPCPQPVFLGYGYVTISGVPGGLFEPQDWFSFQVSTGIYQIDHTIGHTNYIVFVTPFNNLARLFSVQNPTSNSFQIRLADATGSLVDTEFTFQVMTVPSL